MNDQEFFELQLRATIVPQQVRWPGSEYPHWRRLHEAVNEARARVSKAYMQMDEIDRSANFPVMPNTTSAARLRQKRLRTSRHRKRWHVHVRLWSLRWPSTISRRTFRPRSPKTARIC